MAGVVACLAVIAASGPQVPDAAVLSFKKGQVLGSDGRMRGDGSPGSEELFSLETLQAHMNKDSHLASSKLMQMPLPASCNLIRHRDNFDAYRVEGMDGFWFRNQLSMPYWQELAPNAVQRHQRCAGLLARFGLGSARIKIDAGGNFQIRGNLKLSPVGGDCVNVNGMASKTDLLPSKPHIDCHGEIFPLEMQITKLP